MPGSKDRLVEAAVRPCSEDGKLHQSAVEFLRNPRVLQEVKGYESSVAHE